MLSSAESPNVNKKRKLASPTLVECKSPKLLKTMNKQNSFDSPKTNVVMEVIDLDNDDEKASEQLNNEKSVNDETIDNNESSNIQITPKSKTKKPDEKSTVKLGSLTRYLTKTENKELSKNKSESLKENVKPKLTNNSELEEMKTPIVIVERILDNTKVTSESTIEENIEKDESEKDEIDLEQENDISKFESDSESSDDDQVTDNKTDVDESEEKRKNNELLTPRSKKEIELKQKKMTPKQLEKQMEKQKRKDERKQLRLVIFFQISIQKNIKLLLLIFLFFYIYRKGKEKETRNVKIARN